jgi:HAD superfamily hydrolase (TIGR01490 family)
VKNSNLSAFSALSAVKNKRVFVKESMQDKKIAIFDLDHTLLTVNSSYQFGLYLYKTRELSLTTLAAIIFAYLRQRIFHTPLLPMHQQHFDRLFKEKSRAYFDTQASLFVEKHLSLFLNIPVLRRWEQHQAAGDQLVILSGSPTFLVEPIAKRLGAHHAIGTDYAIDSQGRFSHIVRVMDGHDKAEVAAQLAAEHGCHPSDLKAYSDSHLDLPLLQYAGKAVGVNPNRALRRYCLKHGWEVL